MFRKVFFGFLIILLLLTITGCEEEITPKVISDLIFADGIYTAAVLKNSQFQDLSAEEVVILRNSIKNGRELSELTSNDMPDPNSMDYLYIDLTKKNKSGIEIFYNLKEKYIIIPKTQVHEGKSKKYERQLSTMKKYLNGTYKFYPSSEIEKLIASIKENG
jgi:hypothetical protein